MRPVSLGSSAIPSYVWGIDKEGAYLYSVGQSLGQTFAQRRVEHKIESRGECVSLVSVEEVHGFTGPLYRLTLTTSHPSFLPYSTSTTRDIHSFFLLQKYLKVSHPMVTQPSLPYKPILWLSSPQKRVGLMAFYLSRLLTDSELLSDRILHLFLQTQLSTGILEKNMDGTRIDQVASPSPPPPPGPGFADIFKTPKRLRKSFMWHLKFVRSEKEGKEDVAEA